MKKRHLFFLVASCLLLCGSVFSIGVDCNYPSIIEKLLFYKMENFKVFYGGPIKRAEGGAQWIMPVSFEDSFYNTRSVYEIIFVNCNLSDSKDAEILFVDVSDINIKFKNTLQEDYKVFTHLLSGKYSPGKYIVVRLADVSNVFYPDIHVSSPYDEHFESDKQTIANFLCTHFKAKKNYSDYYIKNTKDEIDFENNILVSYKPVRVEIDFSGQMTSFNIVKKVLRNDDWKVYYIITRDNAEIAQGDATETLPLVRIDSGCVSGQLYDDDTCDCLDQLHDGLYQVSQENAKNSLIIHIPAHDGRGYGTAPKAETEIYKRGGRGRVNETKPLDTVSSAMLLYSPGIYDIRTYDGAAKILKEMGFNKVCLLTDNAVKFETLKRHGIEPIRKKTETHKESCIEHIQSKKNSSYYYSN